jgi:hypothetical protein
MKTTFRAKPAQHDDVSLLKLALLKNAFYRKVPGVDDHTHGNRFFNGINMLDAPVFAPQREMFIAYSAIPQARSQRSAMDANDGDVSLRVERRCSLDSGYKHLAPPEQRHVRQYIDTGSTVDGMLTSPERLYETRTFDHRVLLNNLSI